MSRDDERRRAEEAARFDAALDARLRSGWWPLVPEPVHGLDEVAGVVDGLLFLSPADWPAATGQRAPTTTAVALALDELVDARMRTGAWPPAPALLDEHSGEVAGVVEALLSLAPDEWPASDSVSEPSSTQAPVRALHRLSVRTRDHEGTRHPRPSRVLAAAAAVVLVAGAAALALSTGPAPAPTSGGGVPAKMVLADDALRLVAASPAAVAPAGVNGLTCADPTTCLAVADGSAGPVTAYSKDGGKRWRERTAPAGVRGLSSVACDGGTSCFAVATTASGGEILTSSDGGDRWTVGVQPAGLTSPAGIDCPVAGTCLAVGSNGGGAAAVLTTDAGVSWTPLSLPPSVSGITSVACSSAAVCAAAGSAGGSPVLLDTADGGFSWQLTPVTGATEPPLLLCPVDAPCAALTGPSDVELLSGPGDWQALPPPSPAPASGFVFRVPCSDASACSAGPELGENVALGLVAPAAAGGWTNSGLAGVFDCPAAAGSCWAVGLTTNGYAAATVESGSTS